MRVNSSNYKEKFNKLTEGRDSVYYKMISFSVKMTRGSFNLKLRPNFLVAIILFIFLNGFNRIVCYALTRENTGILFIIGFVISIYLAYQLGIYLTEKIFKGQVLEFFTMFKVWDKERKERNK